MQPDSSTGNAIQDASQRNATIRTGTLWSAMPNNSTEKFWVPSTHRKEGSAWIRGL